MIDICDYRMIIKSRLSSTQEKGYRSKLCDFVGCSSGFLSQVTNSHVHLTPDQALRMALFWECSEVEIDYFVTLVNYERASTKELRNYLKNRIEEIQKESLNLKKRQKRSSSEISEDDRNYYYGTWIPSAVHVALSIPGMERSINIADFLRISQQTVLETLRELEKIGLVKKDRVWSVTAKRIHVGRENVYVRNHHQNWRLKMIEVLNRREPYRDEFHYTGCFCLGSEAIHKINDILLQAVTDSEQCVVESEETEFSTLVIDFFRPN